VQLAGRREQIEALVGQTIGNKYRIERLVGSGGMGAVYEALNLSINKRIALKFLFRDDGLDAAMAARFQREAEAASAVESDHIVQIFDAGTSEDGRPYLVMELLDGEDLRQRLKREGRLPLGVTLEIVEQLLRTLGRAHQSGIIHRDLKPDNIFICKRDDAALFVKIVDFGISKVMSQNDGTLTRAGTVLGTAHYMSPEQAQAFADIDGRADLYSLGAILYEALAGRPPHLGRTYEAVLILACTTAAEDIRVHAPDVSAALAAVIAKSIARDREQRYQSAQEFWQALESVARSSRGARSQSARAATSAESEESAFADTEQLRTPTSLDHTPWRSEPRVASETRTLVEAGSPEAPTQRTRRLLAALALLLLGGLVVAALGQRGGKAVGAQGLASSRAEARATATPKIEPVSQSSATLPTAPSAQAVPAPMKSAAPTRSVTKPLASTHASTSASVSAITSSAPPVAPPSGVAGQLLLKTQGP
jgi:serine/threonine-protein kinase